MKDSQSTIVTPQSEYWRSLEELADTADFTEFMQREFPQQAAAWLDPVSRRRFLQLMGASLALAGLGACARQPAEMIVPYVRQPEELIPGKPIFFATAMTLGGYATGVLVESHMGRPTKVEGNADHPASLGATDALAQASILDLYDPDRSQTLRHFGEIRPWSSLLAVLRVAMDAQRATHGTGLRILTETVTSPTLTHQLQTLLTEFPLAKWHQYEPVNRDNVRAGARQAFGEYVETQYRFDKAEVILSLDADFLMHGPGKVRYARDFTSKRRVRTDKDTMNRLYVVEGTPSITGAVADHRLPLRASDITSFAWVVASNLGIRNPITAKLVGSLSTPEEHLASIIGSKWVTALASDLRRHKGRSLVIAGEQQPPVVHVLAHAMNQALGNVGETVLYTDSVEPQPVDQLASLRELVRDMDAGTVELLVILGGNPVYTVPVDLKFGEHLQKVGLRVHLSQYDDETSALCQWHVAEAHSLESWSDARAYDGTVSIVQPLIAPLYDGKSAHELLAVLSDRPERSSYDIVREYWRSWHKQSADTAQDFEQFWRKALHDGVIAGTALLPKSISLRDSWSGGDRAYPPTPDLQSLEIMFQADPTIFDGRFANNGWLQELPKPLTKLTWDNAVLMSPATAERLGVGYKVGTHGGEHGEILADVVELRYQGRLVRAPVWLVPGHADYCVTVHLGYGRARAGKVATGIGFNAYALRTSDAPWFGAGLEIRKTGERYALACTQFHHNVEGRDIIRAATLQHYREHPHFTDEGLHESAQPLSLYPDRTYSGYAWGMAIDVGACIGCNACVAACQAENNIPIVGKSEVLRGREMHWLRIDRYYQGEAENPQTYHQPLPCMHCENAPCEVVCPVAATVHSAEGLNDMVYNRCVGTRYCSNNCPYKVRRFNFFQYADWKTESLKLLRNPDVTVRSRGVMEKCTYCVQRINTARIQAEKEDRKIRDGEIVTACQAACPAEAIVFGDINDSQSRVAQAKAQPLSYGLLTELNTRPRTTYLAALRNPNPELEAD